MTHDKEDVRPGLKATYAGKPTFIQIEEKVRLVETRRGEETQG